MGCGASKRPVAPESADAIADSTMTAVSPAAHCGTATIRTSTANDAWLGTWQPPSPPKSQFSSGTMPSVHASVCASTDFRHEPTDFSHPSSFRVERRSSNPSVGSRRNSGCSGSSRRSSGCESEMDDLRELQREVAAIGPAASPKHAAPRYRMGNGWAPPQQQHPRGRRASFEDARAGLSACEYSEVSFNPRDRSLSLTALDGQKLTSYVDNAKAIGLTDGSVWASGHTEDSERSGGGSGSIPAASPARRRYGGGTPSESSGGSTPAAQRAGRLSPDQKRSRYPGWSGPTHAQPASSSSGSQSHQSNDSAGLQSAEPTFKSAGGRGSAAATF